MLNHKHLNNCFPLQLGGNVDCVHRVRIKSIEPEAMQFDWTLRILSLSMKGIAIIKNMGGT